ncbi:hypothetical protein [Serratia marcescens]|uniref:Morphogenetic protein n=1 Tax=Serratia marcescens TaxID=615 RepID=A0ABD6HLX3_SERMA|nr:hypothetical protein [Serratia marcescens]MVF02755.1 hypothetical protein [Serratia marcescens]
MKERPVIFNGEMVRAILDGRKTQTRRIAKADNSNHLLGCPFGQVGDRLWVRETWADVNHDGHPAIAYRADGGLRVIGEDDGEEEDPNLEKYWFAQWYADLISGAEGNWRPSIHMPRWASRISLEITAVRVERLTMISHEDAIAEGAPRASCCRDPRHGFIELWESIYGKESIAADPWVWVIEFRRVEVEK